MAVPELEAEVVDPELALGVEVAAVAVVAEAAPAAASLRALTLLVSYA